MKCSKKTVNYYTHIITLLSTLKQALLLLDPRIYDIPSFICKCVKMYFIHFYIHIFLNIHSCIWLLIFGLGCCKYILEREWPLFLLPCNIFFKFVSMLYLTHSMSWGTCSLTLFFDNSKKKTLRVILVLQ